MEPIHIVAAGPLRVDIASATFFQEPDCLTELVITRHLVPG